MDTSSFSDLFLDQMRQVGDPEADAVVEEVFATESVEAVNTLLRHLDEDSELMLDRVPPRVRAYLVRTGRLPPWTDEVLLDLGDDLFGRYAPMIIVALHCASLPLCYAAAKGVQVLALTQRMQEYTYRRIMETAQFIMDVMAEGGLGPRGLGLRSCQKVRLLHATIRHHLRLDPAWRAEWGVPINQEDLAGTLMSFLPCVIRSLEKLDIALSPREREVYTHIWSVVGHQLGIDPRLLPSSYEESERLMDVILRRQIAPSAEGRTLTAALVSYMKYILPGNLFDGLIAVLIRYLAGDHIADVLGVEQPDWTRVLLRPLRVMTGTADAVQDRSAMMARLTAVLGCKVLESLQYVSRGGDRYPIRLPRTARERWGISTP